MFKLVGQPISFDLSPHESDPKRGDLIGAGQQDRYAAIVPWSFPGWAASSLAGQGRALVFWPQYGWSLCRKLRTFSPGGRLWHDHPAVLWTELSHQDEGPSLHPISLFQEGNLLPSQPLLFPSLSSFLWVTHLFPEPDCGPTVHSSRPGCLLHPSLGPES